MQHVSYREQSSLSTVTLSLLLLFFLLLRLLLRLALLCRPSSYRPDLKGRHWQVWLGGRVFPLFISEKMDSGKRLLKPLPTLSQLMGVIHLCPFLPDKTLLED